MGGVWLVFLAFPVAGVVDSGESRPRVVAGVAFFVLFAAVYIRGFRTMARAASDAEVVRSGVAHLGGVGVGEPLGAAIVGPEGVRASVAEPL